MAEERNLTRRQRIVVSVLVWVFVGPLVVGFLVMSWVFGLILAAVAVWTTWDYIRRGDVAGHVTDGISKSGYVAKGVEETFFGGDPFDHDDRAR